MQGKNPLWARQINVLVQNGSWKAIEVMGIIATSGACQTKRIANRNFIRLPTKRETSLGVLLGSRGGWLQVSVPTAATA